jgi:hypothetical protein
MDKHALPSKLAQRKRQEVKLKFHPWRNLCLAELSSSAAAADLGEHKDAF